MLKLLKNRDRKEQLLDSIKLRIQMNEEDKVLNTKEFERQLALYKKWLASNSIQGLKY